MVKGLVFSGEKVDGKQVYKHGNPEMLLML